MRAPRKSFVIKLLLLIFTCLVGGAIINVGVAWGCALLRTAPAASTGIHEDQLDVGAFHYLVMDHIGCCVFHGYKKVLSSHSIRNQMGRDLPNVPLPKWVRNGPMFGALSDDPDYRVDAAWGWPLEALAFSICEYWIPTRAVFLDAIVIQESPIPVSVKMAKSDYRFGMLPLRPIFPGFAINTIFYAAIVWVLFAVPGAVRRRVRRKRGQCAACGYSLRDITSDKCPECGHKKGDPIYRVFAKSRCQSAELEPGTEVARFCARQTDTSKKSKP
jgi:hypothetical protein